MLLFVLALACSVAEAAPLKAKLFASGAETFKVVDAKGTTPVFRVLDDTPMKQTLAYAIIGAVNSQTEVKPKVPVHGYIDLKFETLTFKPAQGGKLALSARVSGRDVELEKTVDRKEFMNGALQTVKFDPASKKVALFDVQFRGGQLRFRLDPKSGELIIDDANAKVEFDAPFAGADEESIRFSGKGKRVKSL